MHALRVSDVRKSYGDVTALDGLSLAVDANTTFGLLGTNGAGKTTLFKLLVGLIEPDSGTVEVAGRDVGTAGSDIRRHVGYLPEHAGFPGSLTGREVLEFHAEMRRVPRAERADRADRVAATLAAVGLADAADRRVAGYSNGMNRRLGLATALVGGPRILLLDEPTAGLDPQGVAAFHDVVRRIRDQRDLTVLVSSHVLDEVEALCESVAVVHDGTLRAAGDVGTLKAAVPTPPRVTARIVDGEYAPAAATAAQFGTVASATPDRLVVECPRESVGDLFDALVSDPHVGGIEVAEPGLDDVFDRALAGAASNGGAA